MNLEYVPNFAIRGLHFDIRKGWALKLDTFLNIQKVVYYLLHFVLVTEDAFTDVFAVVFTDVFTDVLTEAFTDVFIDE